MKRRSRLAASSNTFAPSSGNVRRQQGRGELQPQSHGGSASETDSSEVLCIIKNLLKEPTSFRVSASQPSGLSFLHGADADLEDGGHLAFIGAVDNGITVGTVHGTFALESVGGYPYFHPSDGLQQQSRRAVGSKGVPPWILTCEVTRASLRPAASVSLHADMAALLGSVPSLSTFHSLWTRYDAPTLLDECTLIAIEDDAALGEIEPLVRTEGLNRFVLPGAVFFSSESPTALTAQDGTPLSAHAEGGSIVVEFPAHGVWPALLLTGARAPLRLAKTWQLCYTLRRFT